MKIYSLLVIFSLILFSCGGNIEPIEQTSSEPKEVELVRPEIENGVIAQDTLNEETFDQTSGMSDDKDQSEAEVIDNIKQWSFCDCITTTDDLMDELMSDEVTENREDEIMAELKELREGPCLKITRNTFTTELEKQDYHAKIAKCKK
jgi:hypothetical protein